MDTPLSNATPTQIRIHRAALDRRAKFYPIRPTVVVRERVVEIEKPEILTPEKIVSAIRNFRDIPEVLREIREAFPAFFTSDRPVPTAQTALKEIRAACAYVWGVSQVDIASARREKLVVVARTAAMGIARCITNKSLPEIGAVMGGRHHTNVLYAARRMLPIISKITSYLSVEAPALEWATAARKEMREIPLAACKGTRSNIAEESQGRRENGKYVAA